MSTPSIRKKTKLGMKLKSTKQSLSCFPCLPAFNSKENPIQYFKVINLQLKKKEKEKLQRRCNHCPPFIDEEPEA